MNSPKQQLHRKAPVRQKISDAISDPWVEEALAIAFGEYCFRLYGDSPAANDMKRQGAKEFMDVFLNLATEVKTPTPSLTPQLQ